MHQWYWSFEYSDYVSESGDPIEFDSYMLPADRFGKTIPWAQLSNSGDSLKIIVPSRNGNVMCGQNNYLGMVTSCDMNENEMGYRGSKSVFQYPQPNEISVKEQRVDGSYCI